MDNKNEKYDPSKHISVEELKAAIKKEGLEDTVGKALGLDNKNEKPGSGSGKSEDLSSKDLQGFPKADLNQIANIAKDMIVNNKLGLDNEVSHPLSAAIKSRMQTFVVPEEEAKKYANLSEEEIAKTILNEKTPGHGKTAAHKEAAEKFNADIVKDMTINPKLAQAFPQIDKKEFLAELRKTNTDMKANPAVTEENIADKLAKLRGQDNTGKTKDNKPK